MGQSKGVTAKIIGITTLIGALTGLVVKFEELAQTPENNPVVSSFFMRLLGRTPLENTHPDMAETCWFLLYEQFQLWELCIQPKHLVTHTVYRVNSNDESITRCRAQGSATAKGVKFIFKLKEGQCTNSQSIPPYDLECVEPDKLRFRNAIMECSSASGKVSYKKGLKDDVSSFADTCWEHELSEEITVALCTKEIVNRESEEFSGGKLGASLSGLRENDTEIEEFMSAIGFLEITNDSELLWSFNVKGLSQKYTPQGDFNASLQCYGPVMKFNDVSLICSPTTYNLTTGDTSTTEFMTYKKLSKSSD